MRLVTLPDERHLPAVEGLTGPREDGPGIEVDLWDMSAPHPRADEITLAVPPYFHGARILEHVDALTRLEAVQMLLAGVDAVADGIPARVQLANAAGVHDAATAELAVALTLAAQRELPQAVRAQDRGEWLTTTMENLTPSLADSRVLVVGYGRIGQAIARRLAPFEVTITGVARSARPRDDLTARIVGIDELPEQLAVSDVVVLVTPLTPSTRHLVDADAIARMPRDALLVNVARGPVVDTDALVEACRAGRIRAALDVTDPEPLPPGHPLWSCPGVLVNPHRGGASAAFLPRANRLLRAQLHRWALGQPLRHVVRR